MKYLFNYILSFIIIIIIGLFVLDMLILPIIVNKNNNVYLPNYRQLDYRTAQNKLDSIGFKTIIIYHEYSTNFIPNTVIEMSPRPFTKVKEGKVIKLTVVNSPETIIINNYINKSLRDVQLKLDRKYIEIDTIIYEFSNTIKKGNIIDQYPKLSDTLKANQKITLIVSQGNHPNYYVAPYLINISFQKAKEKISRAGLFLGKISYEYDNNYLNNTVLDQSQPANKRLSFPAKIDLILSTDKNGK